MIPSKPLSVRVLEARTRARSHKTRIYEVIPLRLYRTPSESEPGVWRTLRMTPAGHITCDCPGFTNSGMCRHAAALLRRLERIGVEGRIAVIHKV